MDLALTGGLLLMDLLEDELASSLFFYGRVGSLLDLVQGLLMLLPPVRHRLRLLLQLTAYMQGVWDVLLRVLSRVEPCP